MHHNLSLMVFLLLLICRDNKVSVKSQVLDDTVDLLSLIPAIKMSNCGSNSRDCVIVNPLVT